MKTLVLIWFFIFSLTLSAQTSITDELIHEIITECVSKTGGHIIKKETSDNKDFVVNIALPEHIDHYEISKVLSPLMSEIENYYYSVTPWVVDDKGVMCNINIAKDGTNRTLMFVYDPNRMVLAIWDSPNNSRNITKSSSPIINLQNAVVWGAVNLLNGFIREYKQEELISEVVKYQVAIQLQPEISAMTLITDLKPITTMLESTYYLEKSWEQDDRGVLKCEYSVLLNDEHKYMKIQFHFFQKPHVLLLNFATACF